jgi:hypothetical protein
MVPGPGFKSVGGREPSSRLRQSVLVTKALLNFSPISFKTCPDHRCRFTGPSLTSQGFESELGNIITYRQKPGRASIEQPSPKSTRPWFLRVKSTLQLTWGQIRVKGPAKHGPGIRVRFDRKAAKNHSRFSPGFGPITGLHVVEEVDTGALFSLREYRTSLLPVPKRQHWKGCTVLHTGLISCSTGTSIRARGPDCPALGSQRGSSYHELRTLLPPNKSYQVRLASVEPRTSRRHVRHNFITSEGEIPVQCLTTEPRPDDKKKATLEAK